MPESITRDKPDSASRARKKEFHEKIAPLCDLFLEQPDSPAIAEPKVSFLNDFQAGGDIGGTSYIDTIKSLPAHTADKGTEWLRQIIAAVCRQATELLPALKLFRK
jgi:hypothetical protein